MDDNIEPSPPIDITKSILVFLRFSNDSKLQSNVEIDLSLSK